MTQLSITSEERRELEASYRQAISLARTLARLLGYPCPIVTRAEKRTTVQDIDNCGIVEAGFTATNDTGHVVGTLAGARASKVPA